MKLQPFRQTAVLLLAGLVLVSVTIAPAMAAGAINQEMASLRSATPASQSISHGIFHHLHPAVIMGWKWWHYLAVAVGVIIVATVAPVVASNWISFFTIPLDTASTAASSVVL